MKAKTEFYKIYNPLFIMGQGINCGNEDLICNI